MERSYLTTTEAAKLLSVSSDTVLKWVKAGKIESYRTPGGHCRIPFQAIKTILPKGTTLVPESPSQQTDVPYEYCWEYNAGEDGIPIDCEECVVYRSRARRCYELRDIPEEAGLLKHHCETDCEACDYYKLVSGLGLHVLFVSSDERFHRLLQREETGNELQLQFARNEYECALLIENFRPDFIIVDTSMGMRKTREVCDHLSEDSRIPFTRIVLTSTSKRYEDFCSRELFGWIRKPFTCDQLKEYINSPGSLLSDS